ncbi:hypothetical protein [Pseudomonas sp. LRF_L74]|uniref:hypothetical protein n=1 Tax=Pseudomonas sp. LRF_L74 TaxID=3369422 RepID=UPI003F62942C
MSDPRQPGSATPPPTIGEGCVRRYDPQALSEDAGTDFPDAEALWQELERERKRSEGQ